LTFQNRLGETAQTAPNFAVHFCLQDS